MDRARETYYALHKRLSMMARGSDGAESDLIAIAEDSQKWLAARSAYHEAEQAWTKLMNGRYATDGRHA